MNKIFKDTVKGKMLLNEDVYSIDVEMILQLFQSSKIEKDVLKLIVDYTETREDLEEVTEYPVKYIIDGFKSNDFSKDDFSHDFKDKIKELNKYLNS